MSSVSPLIDLANVVKKHTLGEEKICALDAQVDAIVAPLLGKIGLTHVAPLHYHRQRGKRASLRAPRDGALTSTNRKTNHE